MARQTVASFIKIRLGARGCWLPLLLFALMGATATAQAQSSGCDQFKETLSSRIDPSIRAFSLEIVPSSEPVPPGAKVFGTCDGGAYKILFRRGGNSRPAAAETNVATPSAPPASAPTTPVAAPRKGPSEQSERAKRSVRAPSPSAAPALAVRSTDAAVVPPSLPPARQAEPTLPTSSVDETAGPVAVQIAEDDASNARPTTDSMPAYARWVGGLLLLLALAALWAWWAHHSAYDAAGLPRGPKLTID